MPFKRAGWLQLAAVGVDLRGLMVSMPFKRAGWLQPTCRRAGWRLEWFQCPLSGLVGCNRRRGGSPPASLSFNAL